MVEYFRFMPKLTAFCSSIGVVGATLISFVGGWDTNIETLIVFMAVDFITGLACAVFFGKSEKSQNGGLSSAVCWKGIIKKLCTLIMVSAAYYADKMIGTDYLRNAVIIAFCVSELISICENAGQMGILPANVQKIFSKIIDILKSKDDSDK